MAELRKYRVDVKGDGSSSDYLWVDAETFESAKGAAEQKLLESFKTMTDAERKYHPHGKVWWFVTDEKTGDFEEFTSELPALPTPSKLCLCESCRKGRKGAGLLEYPYMDGRKTVVKE